MNYIIKQIILLSIIFILILWFQYYDNIKNNISYCKLSLYDKIKLPLLVCAIIGFLLNLNLNLNNNNIDIELINNYNDNDNLMNIKTINNNENIFKSCINTSDKIDANLLIFTDLPEF
jgi:hypothetical protein